MHNHHILYMWPHSWEGGVLIPRMEAWNSLIPRMEALNSLIPKTEVWNSLIPGREVWNSLGVRLLGCIYLGYYLGH